MMKKFNYKTGTILGLEGTRHMGVVIDSYKTVELIAVPDNNYGQICKLHIIDLKTQDLHPVTNKSFSYNKLFYDRPFSVKELLLRVKEIAPKYQDTPYNKITNNCQHFAYEIVTGKRKSPDADPWKWAAKFHKQLSTLEKLTTNGSSASNYSASNSSSLKIANFKNFKNEINQLISQA